MNQQTRPYRILIGTPCGQGQASVQYMLSIIEVFQRMSQMKHLLFVRNNLRIGAAQGLINEDNLRYLQQLESQNLIDFEIGLYTLAQESLLSRGRNHIAAVAIRQGWDKLFFIDADARFTADQFLSVALSPHDLTAGACPLKVFPISLNYLPFKEDEHYYKDRIRSMDSFLKMREGHGSQHVPVAYIGTAFMALTRKLLLHCASVTDEYMYPNPSTGHTHTHWNMFDTKPMHGKFMSEDWSMCERARSLGYPVMMDMNVVISHVGNWVFAPEQAQITHMPKETVGVDEIHEEIAKLKGTDSMVTEGGAFT